MGREQLLVSMDAGAARHVKELALKRQGTSGGDRALLGKLVVGSGDSSSSSAHINSTSPVEA